jgi:hypothetical protein
VLFTSRGVKAEVLANKVLILGFFEVSNVNRSPNRLYSVSWMQERLFDGIENGRFVRSGLKISPSAVGDPDFND